MTGGGAKRKGALKLELSEEQRKSRDFNVKLSVKKGGWESKYFSFHPGVYKILLILSLYFLNEIIIQLT